MTRTLTTTELCELFDITQKTVQRWVARGCPCDRRSGKARMFNGDEVAAWMKENKLTGNVGAPSEATGPVGEQLKAAKLRKELAMAEKHEIALAREKGLLVEAAKVEAENVEKFTLIRNRLLGLPAQASSFLVGRSAVEIEGELDRRVKEILVELSKS
jgi:excisionase family DNA binding protein